MVFSWQLLKASDEVRITLLRKGMVVKHWRGCWNECDALLHMGTLPVQVVFNGKPQPMAEDPDMLILPVQAGQANGTYAGQMPVPGHALSANTPDGGEETFPERGVQVPNMFVEVQPGPGEETPQATLIHMLPEEEREEQAFEQKEEECEGDVDGAVEKEEGEMEPEGSEGGDVAREETPTTEALLLPAGKHVTAFHANSLVSDEALRSLKDRVSQMSPKTIIVDLRVQYGKHKKYQVQSGLSKEALRATFGGKYWDRSWAVKTTLKIRLATENRIAIWQSVVVTPHHPDGVPALVEYYRQGYSIVIMDNRAAYEESARRAVIEALRQLVPDLEVGPVS